MEFIKSQSSLFKVSYRTIYRWEKLGIDLANHHAVALHIANQYRSAPEAVAAAIAILESLK